MRAIENTSLRNRPGLSTRIASVSDRSIGARHAKREREAADLDEADAADLARGDIEHGPTLSSVVGNDAVDHALIESALLRGKILEHHPREALKRPGERRRVAVCEGVVVLRDEGFGEGVDLAGHLAFSGLR